MKKSKHIELILITAVLASCNRPSNDWDTAGSKTYVRSDSTAPYTRTRHYHSSGISPLLWYYAFRPYGHYTGEYRRAGYYSNAIHETSNVGSNGYKAGIIRGGFGNGSYSVGS